MTEAPPTARNKELQREMYGEPLSDIVGRICGSLEMSQANVADIVGLSPAMLSQLGGGQRVKIGNPAVLERMRGLDELARLRAVGTVGAAEVPGRIESIRALNGAVSRVTTTSGLPVEAGIPPVVRGLQSVLRAVASADEILEAASTISADHPGLAELLRVYGTGRTDTAVDHYNRIRPML